MTITYEVRTEKCFTPDIYNSLEEAKGGLKKDQNNGTEYNKNRYNTFGHIVRVEKKEMDIAASTPADEGFEAVKDEINFMYTEKNVQTITVDDVYSIYRGKPTDDVTDWRGEYTYTSKHRKWAEEQKCSEIDDAEVNDKEMKELLNNFINSKVIAEKLDEHIFSKVINGEQYTIFIKF